jgi:hypothetical protein
MNFVPGIPQLAQQNQGTGFGDWQQYAGYGKDNPFGGSGGVPPKATGSIGVPAPVDEKSTNLAEPENTQPINYSIAPNQTMGASPSTSMGMSLTFKNNISNDIYSAFGVSK